MRVLLVDLDSTGFGNLALMKLSAWHKAQGDEVFLGQAAAWDLSRASCVFTFNAGQNTYPRDARTGGSGFRSVERLPDPIEHIMPDYLLYGHDLGHSMGFTSRGCLRRCPWCVVPEKEGGIVPWADFHEFWDRRHSRIMLLDNNLLAAPNCKETLEGLAKEGPRVDFNQGLDIRLLDDEKAYWLSKVQAYFLSSSGDWPGLRFSFDLPQMEGDVRRGVALLQQRGIEPGRLSFYVLVGYNTSFEEDKARFSLLKELGCQAFPMFYMDEKGVEHQPTKGRVYERQMPHGSRWAIRKYIRLANGVNYDDRH